MNSHFMPSIAMSQNVAMNLEQSLKYIQHDEMVNTLGVKPRSVNNRYISSKR